jgi:hypothetical protein
MNELEGWELKSALLDTLVNGEPLTAAKLARWHRYGVLPRPVQRGRLTGGSETVYPPGTKPQLVALCDLLARRRSLRAAAWTLWWQGYPVEIKLIRNQLEEGIAEWQKDLDALSEPDGRPTEQGHKELKRLTDTTRRLKTKIVRRVRKRVASQNMERLGEGLLLLVRGVFPAASSEPEIQQDFIETALGLDRVQDGRNQVLPDDYLPTLSALMRTIDFQTLLRTSSNELLLKTRDDLRRRLFEVNTAEAQPVSFEDAKSMRAVTFLLAVRLQADHPL